MRRTRGMSRLFFAVALLASAAAAAAGLREVSAVPHLDERGRAAYAEFLQAETHRAFVIAPGGSWAWRAEMPSPEQALEAALRDCRGQTEQRCAPYAVDGEVVFDAKAWPTSWGPYADKAQAARAAVGVRRGQRFPDLRVRDRQGRARSISEYRGRVVVVHFWGSWCPHCIKELPDLERLHSVFRDAREVQFMLLSVREPFQTSREWARKQGIRLPLFDGGEGAEKEGSFRLADGGTIRDRELARVFPTTYVLDRQGLVVFSHTGPVARWPEYAPFLRDALARSGR